MYHVSVKAWTYVDAGNALYLQWAVNMDHIVDVLQQMPGKIIILKLEVYFLLFSVGLRGFAMNVGSFVNSTYNMQLASELHCQTGLNYVIDTSRNGGIFSDRSMDEINECTYDPPYISRYKTLYDIPYQYLQRCYTWLWPWGEESDQQSGQ